MAAEDLGGAAPPVDDPLRPPQDRKELPGHSPDSVLGTFLRFLASGGRPPTLAGIGRPLLRWLAPLDHFGEQGRQPPPGRAIAPRQFGHLGEAQLRVGGREASFGLFRGRQQGVEPGPLTDSNPAPPEQLPLPIEGPHADPQLGQDGHAVPRGFSQEANEAMEPRGTLQRDMERGAPSPARGTTHDRTIQQTPAPTRHSTRRQLRGYLQTTSIDR